jgi:hypothetical protein
MKVRTSREMYGEGIQQGVLFTTYALALALNDLYGWKDAAVKVAAATAEIVNGYALTSDKGKALEDMAKEMKERGIEPFIVREKKGGKSL